MFKIPNLCKNERYTGADLLNTCKKINVQDDLLSLTHIYLNKYTWSQTFKYRVMNVTVISCFQ